MLTMPVSRALRRYMATEAREMLSWLRDLVLPQAVRIVEPRGLVDDLFCRSDRHAISSADIIHGC